ncbi:TRAP transporter large permease [Aquibacillus sediminis]|uniref:TRAP transporter large permease n=1 Tax=Aquibacillus sediminis TaxID=2574734 RepID=UPI001109C776|nr:TRAP transporter large permease [Aquibacillus sediminis]
MLIFILFIVLLLIGVPIALVLGITSILYIILSDNMGLLLTAPQRLFSGIESNGLIAIPLFMLAGELMNSGGITKRLISFSQVLLGHYRGGLAYVNVVANMFLASIIGSATAQIAMMSKMMVPAMEKEGYKKEFSTSITAASGILGPIIPPSMMFIIYGVTSGQSIGTMFLAGIIPGVLLIVGYIALISFIGYKHNLPISQKQPLSKLFTSLFQVLPALLVPIVIIVGILGGIFTPTESAAIACLIAFIVGFAYRELGVKDIPSIFINTTHSTAIVTLLIAMASLFGWVLTFEGVPQAISEWMITLTENPLLFLLLLNILLLLIGTVMDGIAALIILVPIFSPLLPLYDIDPIHFGVIISINLTIGLLTPPVGTGLFIASSISGVKFESLSKAILPFLGVALLVLILLTYFPQLVLWIPSMAN